MSTTVVADSSALWDQLLQLYRASDMIGVNARLSAPDVDRVGVIRYGLKHQRGGHERGLVFHLLRGASPAQLQELFPELIQLARAAHGPIQRVWELILSLPRDWVLNRIECEVNPILAGEEYDDYWMFLELYERLDHSLARRLAERALAHADPDIRERGEMTLEHLA